MILCVANVLSEAELRRVVSDLTETEFRDGRATAGWHAREVKQNLQAPGPASAAAAALVEDALRRNALFRMAAIPRRIRPILFNRYETGMSYGSHLDDALMGEMAEARSDLSLTLFLSDPRSYEGGELVIESSAGEEPYKLEAGAMILYPSYTLHRVEPVRAGVRLAAVTWVQSAVRDASRREVLFDLDTARRSLFDREGKTREFDLVSKSYSNLLRLWAEV